MSDTIDTSAHLIDEQPAASAPGGVVDRRELAFVAVERTRMPMAVADMRQTDSPIVLANQAFLDLTGYSADEVIGRNCRFLQGPGTDRQDIARLREAIGAEREIGIELLNYRKDGSSFCNDLYLSPVHDDHGALMYYFASQMDVTEERKVAALEKAELRLLREIDHRAKNALALVQSIVRLSRADDAASYAGSVQGRVETLARAHEMLAADGWRDVSLEQLIRSETKSFDEGRISLDGSTATIPAGSVQPLALLLHELFDNAVRHGALSVDEGRVDVSWRTDETNRSIEIKLTETGGPPLPEVRLPGFGSAIVDGVMRYQLGGSAVFEWKPEGLDSLLTLPAQRDRPMFFETSAK